MLLFKTVICWHSICILYQFYAAVKIDVCTLGMKSKCKLLWLRLLGRLLLWNINMCVCIYKYIIVYMYFIIIGLLQQCFYIKFIVALCSFKKNAVMMKSYMKLFNFWDVDGIGMTHLFLPMLTNVKLYKTEHKAVLSFVICLKMLYIAWIRFRHQNDLSF